MNINTLFSELFTGRDFTIITLPRNSNRNYLKSLSSNKIAGLLSAAFLIRLCGTGHPLFTEAASVFDHARSLPEMKDQAAFFDAGLSGIEKEFTARLKQDDSFAAKADALYKFIAAGKSFPKTKEEKREAFWSLFFPEAAGILNDKNNRKKELRKKRIVEITSPSQNPILHPGEELIFTSNIILTLPETDTDPSSLNLPSGLVTKVKDAMREEQLFFYDHPIQIGTKPENNEILYGLQGLEESCRWEKTHGNMGKNEKLTCVLSVTVTHKGLQSIAKEYIHHEITQYGNFKNLDIYVFTEEDTQTIINTILLPAYSTSEGRPPAKPGNNGYLLNKVFGVNGEYGRHYSFLKAIAAFWQVFIDDTKRGTFKIDLDQIFPEQELKTQTGKSAFEHFENPLWGGTGKDSFGNNVELGMIAGALVNEKDIRKGIYTPDVTASDTVEINPETLIFYSKLMMGFSTEAELMTRYGENDIDGRTKCIQRIHVTGGTNGILTKHLRAYRPFTPTFIGRAEDQCYILSVLSTQGTKLAYLHEDGLIMRHDKEVFASNAIKAASFGSTIGDYVRILYFSKYVDILSGGNPQEIKKVIDPFTGCFVSKIPVTIVYLRYTLKALEIFRDTGAEQGKAFLFQGRKRIKDALTFTEGEESLFTSSLKEERKGWDLFYDILDDFEAVSRRNLPKERKLKETARDIINNCRV